MNNIESKPSLSQLKRLASIGASSTIESASRRRNTRTGEYYAIDRLDSIIVRGESDDLESVRHTMGVRIGKRAVDDAVAISRLEYFDTYRVERNSAAYIKAATKYEFEWSARRVILARRLSSLVIEQESVPSVDLGDAILNFHVRDNEASILEAQIDFEQVTHEDCDQLIESTAAYYAQISAVNRQSVS